MQQVTSAVIHSWNCDAQEHLNTRHYVGIFDDANQILLDRIAGRSRDVASALGWADVRNELDFMAEITAGTVVDVFAAIRRIGPKSLTIATELRRANSDDVCARMVAIITRFDLTARRAVTLSQPLIESARAWLEPHP
ncbi:MAG TPA: acyl-CoA thioesterase [Steroidobacteraceae bacterium]|nr:acyl-CoA thioesterase [Steroidobacteraceae bacterium]